MTNTESIRMWFLDCPTIASVMDFNADYLGDDTNACTIYSLPSNLHYTEDITGAISFRGVQTLSFLFALRAPYGDDLSRNLENLQFFDKVKEWMYKQNTQHNFPHFDEGEIKSIMPVQTEYISSSTSDTASYQMRCEVKYWREE